MNQENSIIEAFKESFQSIRPLNEQKINEIIDISQIKELKIGEYFFHEGMYAKKVAFIFKGYLRKYYLKDGKELTDK